MAENLDSNLPRNSDIWVFGYGSLIWKVDFPFEKSQTGFIKGFERKFYQNSIDHRGTPQKPGRVVTLINSTNQSSQVWGVAYKIPDKQVTEVLNHLDYREKNGYERHTVKFYPYPDSEKNISNETELQSSSSSILNIIIYVANKDNQSWNGNTNICDIVNQIYCASGPSGTNREYVYCLADAMRKLFPGQIDEHLYQLESMLREREKNDRQNQICQ